MTKILNSVSRKWHSFENTLLAIFMFLMFILVGYTVLVRYIVGGTLPSSWAEVMVRLILACVAFYGATVVERDQEHFTIGVVVDALGKRKRLSVKVLADLIVLAFLVLIAKEALAVIPNQMQQFSGSWSVLPFGIWHLLVLLMAILMFCYIIVRMIRNFREVLRP